MQSLEWIGQMVASLLWIISVVVKDGAKNNGDYLQLGAAISWMVSNIASVT